MRRILLTTMLALLTTWSLQAQKPQRVSASDTIVINMRAARVRFEEMKRQKAVQRKAQQQRYKKLHKLPKAREVVPDSNDVNIPERVTR